jgi:hypothetical protein
MDFITGRDMFGAEVKLHLNGLPNHKSCFGGCCTICTKCTVFFALLVSLFAISTQLFDQHAGFNAFWEVENMSMKNVTVYWLMLDINGNKVEWPSQMIAYVEYEDGSK